MLPRNKTHDDGVLHIWFIFNLHTRVFCLYTTYSYFIFTHNFIEPLAKTMKNPYLLGGPASCSWWKIRIHSVPLSGNNCPTLWLLPLSPLSHPSVHITLFTMPTSTVTVFYVWDINALLHTIHVHADISIQQQRKVFFIINHVKTTILL